MRLSTLGIGSSLYIGNPSIVGAWACRNGFSLTPQRFRCFRIFCIISSSYIDAITFISEARLGQAVNNTETYGLRLMNLSYFSQNG